MSHLSYSFCLTILHSLWQAAALLLLFILLDKSINKKNNQKKSFIPADLLAITFIHTHLLHLFQQSDHRFYILQYSRCLYSTK